MVYKVVKTVHFWLCLLDAALKLHGKASPHTRRVAIIILVRLFKLFYFDMLVYQIHL